MAAKWTPTQRTLEVEGYHGEKVQTLSQYNVFRDQFELCLTHMTRSSLHQPTEGGQHGADQHTLAEVLEMISDRPDKQRTGPRSPVLNIYR